MYVCSVRRLFESKHSPLSECSLLSHSLIPCCDCHCHQLVFNPGSETIDYYRDIRKMDLNGYPPNGELNYGRSCVSKYKSHFPLMFL